MGKYESAIFNCPLDAALQAIGGKWKGIILFHLARGKLRFNQLQKSIGTVTERMLIRQLRELERDKLITRTVYPVVPPKVEYEITEFGQTLNPLLTQLNQWGRDYMRELEKSRS
jgi:DNA-binding HxlR family transcriptional regulator